MYGSFSADCDSFRLKLSKPRRLAVKKKKTTQAIDVARKCMHEEKKWGEEVEQFVM